MDENRKPAGVLIFGGLNCFVFGLLFLFIFSVTFFKVKPQDLNTVVELFKSKGLTVEITYKQFRAINFLYMLISLIFFISGQGLLQRREWARKLTVYFSFCWLSLLFFTAATNFGLVSHLIVYAVYPGVLIMYFTNKNIENYFKS